MLFGFWSSKSPPRRDNTPPDSDAALVTAYREGDAHAFDALYEKHVRSVFCYARGLTGRSADAEDVTQETFIAAIDGFRDLRQTDAVLPFLLGIAVRQWHSQFRRKARRERIVPTAPWNDGGAEIASGGSVEQSVIVRDALQALADSDRAAFLLVAQAGLTHREAAAALGLPLGVVKWRILRATTQLRQLLGEENSTVSDTPLRPIHSEASEVIFHVSQS